MNSIMEKLKKPFKEDEIEWRIGVANADKTKGLALAYVTNRAIQNRLDEVFGCFGWQNQFKEWKKDSQICGISVYDNEKKEWITKWDGADDSNTEAIKGGLSDSMKRAAYQWGIGRYLYEIPQVWVKIKQVGKGYVLDEKVKLPDWAIPIENKDKYQKIEVEENIPELSPNIKELKHLCELCSVEITGNVANFSKNKFGKELCMNCQKKV